MDSQVNRPVSSVRDLRGLHEDASAGVQQRGARGAQLDRGA